MTTTMVKVMTVVVVSFDYDTQPRDDDDDCIYPFSHTDDCHNMIRTRTIDDVVVVIDKLDDTSAASVVVDIFPCVLVASSSLSLSSAVVGIETTKDVLVDISVRDIIMMVMLQRIYDQSMT